MFPRPPIQHLASARLRPAHGPTETAFESLRISRSADDRELFGSVAVGVALLGATVARAGVPALVRRYATESPVFVPGQWVDRRSDREVWWYAFALIAVPGLVAAALPIAPLIVPAVLLGAAGAAPGLLVAAARLRRAEAETGHPVWLCLPSTDRRLAQMGGRPLS